MAFENGVWAFCDETVFVIGVGACELSTLPERITDLCWCVCVDRSAFVCVGPRNG